MHIAYLTPEYVKDGAYDGGLANYLAKVGQMLVQRGHKVTILVSSDRDISWMDSGISIIEFKKTKLLSMKYRWKGKQFIPVISNLMTGIRFKNIVLKIHKEYPFDLIQTSSYMAPGYALRHNGHFPMVCRVSSYTPVIRSAFGYQRSFGDYLMDWMEIRQTLDADSSYAPSFFLAETYRKLEGFQPDVIRTPLALEFPDEDNILFIEEYLDMKYLLFFGTLSQIKGVDLFAQIIPSILEKYPEIHFVFIGRDDGLPGGGSLFDFIFEKCKSHFRRLHYHSAVSKQQLYPIIKHAVGVIMPSRVDNYPNACLEALSCGIPVIGTDQSSLEEMIIDGQTGFLARNSNPISIENAIERLLNLSDEERTSMRESIWASIEDIKKENRVEQLINYYQAVINRFQK